MKSGIQWICINHSRCKTAAAIQTPARTVGRQASTNTDFSTDKTMPGVSGAIVAIAVLGPSPELVLVCSIATVIDGSTNESASKW